jgi:hypothetical protein
MPMRYYARILADEDPGFTPDCNQLNLNLNEIGFFNPDFPSVPASSRTSSAVFCCEDPFLDIDEVTFNLSFALSRLPYACSFEVDQVYERRTGSCHGPMASA